MGSPFERATVFLGRMFGREEGEEGDPETGPASPHGAPAVDDDAARAWFLARLRGLVETGGSAVAGHVQLISMAPVKDRLGPLWPAMAPRAMRLARTIVEERVGPRDVVLIYDDISFLILFAETAGAEARLLCLALAQEVVAALLGDAILGGGDGDREEGDVGLRTALLDSERLSAWLADAQDALVPPLPAEIVGAPVERERVVVATQAPVPPPERTEPPPPHAVEDYQFLPFMNVASGTVVGFRVTWPLGTPPIPLGEENRQLLSDLDRLEAARRLFFRMAERGEEALLMLPIHFAALRRVDRRTVLRQAIEALEAEFRRHLVVDFHGLPPGVPGPRLLEFAASLHGAARATVLRLPRIDDLDSVPPGTHLHALIADRRELPNEPEAAERALEDLAERVALRGFRLFVGHVDRVEDLALVSRSGARYVSGLGVGPPVRDPHGLKLAPGRSRSGSR